MSLSAETLGIIATALFTSASSKAGTLAIMPHDGHSQVRRAAARLENWIWEYCELPSRGEIVLLKEHPAVPEIGEQGYRLRSISRERIEVCANTDAGLANGIYGLLLAIRSRQLTRPFAENWDLQERPQWEGRRIELALFGMDISKLTPDTWTIDDWKEYIDFSRGLNVNHINLMNVHLYHPEIPETFKEQWRLDAYIQMIEYAHENGMTVSLLFVYNQVPTPVFWEHPEAQTNNIHGYFGQTLSWVKAKDVILKYQTDFLKYLRGLDGIEIMLTEPLGWDNSDAFVEDPAAVFLDAVLEYRRIFREINPVGEVVFLNWMLGHPSLIEKLIAGFALPPALVEKVPSMWKQLLDKMPRDVVYHDISLNQFQRVWSQIDASRDVEILKLAPEKGHRAVDFMFFMDREFGMLNTCQNFPKPFLDMIMQEFDYAKTLPITDVSSYRLAPFGRFLCDFFYMRKAWDADLSREQLVQEAAGYLTTNARDKAKLVTAIMCIERYWEKRERADLLTARDAFREVVAASGSPAIELTRLSQLLLVLAEVDDYARSVKEVEDAKASGKDSVVLEAAAETKAVACYEFMKRGVFP